MAKINTKKLLDIEKLMGDVVVKANQYQGLYSAEQANPQAVTNFEVAGNDLLVTTQNINGDSFNITVTDYFKKNGKSKFNYIVGSGYDSVLSPNAYIDILAEGLVYNKNKTTADSLYYSGLNMKTGAEKYSYTQKGTEFSDEFDFTGFQNTNSSEKKYITKGFTINAGSGDDKITGSILDDTITGGKGDNVIAIKNDNSSFGDDVYKPTAGENIDIDLGGDLSDGYVQVQQAGKDAKVTVFGKTTYDYARFYGLVSTPSENGYVVTGKMELLIPDGEGGFTYDTLNPQDISFNSHVAYFSGGNTEIKKYYYSGIQIKSNGELVSFVGFSTEQSDLANEYSHKGQIYGETSYDENIKMGTITLTGVANKDITDSISVNGNRIDIEYDESDIDKNSITGSGMDDFVDVSSYKNADKKGITISTGFGNDTIMGSYYADTITGGTGNNEIYVDITNGIFGNDIVNLTKEENLKLSVQNSGADVNPEQLEISVQDKDVVVKAYSTADVSAYKIDDVATSDNKAQKVYTHTTTSGTFDTYITQIYVGGITPGGIFGPGECYFYYKDNGEIVQKTLTADDFGAIKNANPGYAFEINREYRIEGLLIGEDNEGIRTCGAVLEVSDAEGDFPDGKTYAQDPVRINYTYQSTYVYDADSETWGWSTPEIIGYSISDGIVVPAEDLGYSATLDGKEVQVSLTKNADDIVIPADYNKEYYLVTITGDEYNTLNKQWDIDSTVYIASEELIEASEYIMMYKNNATCETTYELSEDVPSDEELAHCGENVIYNSEKTYMGSMTVKNAAVEGALGNYGVLSANDIQIASGTKYSEVSDVTDDYFNTNVKIDKTTSVATGTILGDIIDLSDYVVNGSNGFTVNAGSGNDKIIGSNANDVITAGSGRNIIEYSALDNEKKFGDDVIKLSKSEVTSVLIHNELPSQLEYSRDGSDIKVTVYGTKVEDEQTVVDETNILGTIKFENAVTQNNYESVSVNGNRLSQLLHDDVITLTGKSFNGTYVDDNVAVSESANLVNYTINAGEGNNVINLSNAKASSKNTITAGSGADTVINGAGNDTYKLGKSDIVYEIANRVNYDVSDNKTIGNDTIVVDKDSLNEIIFSGDIENQIVSSVDSKGNILFTVYGTKVEDEQKVVDKTKTLGTVTVQGLAKKDLFSDGDDYGITVKTHDIDNEDLRNLTYVSVVSDNVRKFSGTYINDSVVAAEGTTKNLTVNLGEGKNVVDLSNSSGSNTINSNGDRNIVTGGSGSDTYTLGNGYNYISIDVDKAFGNDVVKLTKDEKLTFILDKMTYSSQFEYVRSENDIKINIYGVNDSGVDYDDVKGTITIKDAYKKDIIGENGYISVIGYSAEKEVVISPFDIRSEGQYTELFLPSQKSYTGSYLNDKVIATYASKGVTIDAKDGENTITGSSKNDKITAGMDDDSVTATSGGDTYTLGAGKNTVTYDMAKQAGTYEDTYKLTAGEKLVFLFDNLYDPAQLEYVKNGNDVVINAYNDADTPSVVAKITLKDYAKHNKDVSVYINGETNADNLLNKSVDFVAASSKKNTFAVNYDTNCDFGNIKISSYDGAKDTIKLTQGSKSDIKLTAYDLDFSYRGESGTTLKIVSDDNSIIYEAYDESSADPVDNLENITFKDAKGTSWKLKNVTSNTSITLSDKQNNILMTGGMDDGIVITSGKKNDIIFGSDNKQTFNYVSGKDLYKGGDGNDTYQAALNKNTSLIISETDGKNDTNTLNLSTGMEDAALFFNVKADDEGNAVIVEDTELYIYNKASYLNAKSLNSMLKDLKGVIVLDNYFDENQEIFNDKAYYGNGYIAQVRENKTSDAEGSDVNMLALVDTVAQSVAAWLYDHQNYADVYNVVESGNKADIQSLMNVFNTTNYVN